MEVHAEWLQRGQRRPGLHGLLRRVATNESFEGEGVVKPQRGEFLCPVCRRIANSLMPLAPCAADRNADDLWVDAAELDVHLAALGERPGPRKRPKRRESA